MTPHEHLIEETAKREKSDARATAGLLALELMHEIRNPLDALDNLLYLFRRRARPRRSGATCVWPESRRPP